MISFKNVKPGEGMILQACDPASHYPDVSCPQCETGKYSVLEIGCGAGAIVSDREPGYVGDEALDEAEPVSVYFQHADVSCGSSIFQFGVEGDYERLGPWEDETEDDSQC